jgi:hypothetical protein
MKSIYLAYATSTQDIKEKHNKTKKKMKMKDKPSKCHANQTNYH